MDHGWEEEDEGTGSDMTEGQAGTQWPYSQEAQPSGRRLLPLSLGATAHSNSLSPDHLGAPTNLILPIQIPICASRPLTPSRAPTTHRHLF